MLPNHYKNGVDIVAITRRKRTIGGGIAFTALTDEKLKTNSFIIHFMMPLTEENAAANAAIPFVLEDTCRAYPDITSFSRRLAALYGANVRGGIRRFSDSQVITFSGGCIADKYALNGEEVSAALLELLCGCIFEPVLENGIFPEKHFELKKQELIDDIDADINDKRSYAIKKAGKIIFENEPAGIAVKGEKEAAAALTSGQVYKAYENMLRTAKIEIIFVGGSLPEKCEKMLEEKFSSIERDNIYKPEIIPSPAKAEPRFVTEKLDVVQSKMVIGFKHASEADSLTSTELLPIAKVFNAVYGATPFSKLFKNVREKLSLCYYCSASYNDSKRTVYVDSGVEGENIEAARKEILNQLDDIRNGSFTDELFEQSKLYLTCALKGVNDTPRAVADWYFGYCLETEEKTLTPESFIERINTVTREQVCEFAGMLKLDTVYVLTGNE